MRKPSTDSSDSSTRTRRVEDRHSSISRRHTVFGGRSRSRVVGTCDAARIGADGLRTIRRTLTIAEHDAYCDQAAPLAIALKARSDEVPRTWAEARAYLDRMYGSGTLEVTEQAQTLSRAVLSPPAAAAWVAGPATWTTASSRWACCRRRSDGRIASTGRASISGRQRAGAGAPFDAARDAACRHRWPEARVPASPGIHLPNGRSPRSPDSCRGR